MRGGKQKLRRADGTAGGREIKREEVNRRKVKEKEGARVRGGDVDKDGKIEEGTEGVE